MSSATEGHETHRFVSKATSGWSTTVSARRYLECTHGTIGNIGHLSANLWQPTELEYCSEREFFPPASDADCLDVSTVRTRISRDVKHIRVLRGRPGCDHHGSAKRGDESSYKMSSQSAVPPIHRPTTRSRTSRPKVSDSRISDTPISLRAH